MSARSSEQHTTTVVSKRLTALLLTKHAMERLRIYRPAFDEGTTDNIDTYSIRMQQHLQDMEDWIQTMHEEQQEGWGISQMWVMEHKDGRVARLPDPYPAIIKRIKARAKKREEAWMRYYMKRNKCLTKLKQKKMNKTKNKYSGSVLFNGELTVTIGGEKKTLKTDYLGGGIRHADTDREIIVMLKKNIGYNEVDTGYVVRRDDWYEKEHSFGLKSSPNNGCCTLVDYNDVIAWGYADGKGENPMTMTKEQVEAQRKELLDQVKGKSEQTQMKVRLADGDIQVAVVVQKGQLEDYVRATAKHLPECAENFIDFNKKHPEIVEMHFFTAPTFWEEED